MPATELEQRPQLRLVRDLETAREDYATSNFWCLAWHQILLRVGWIFKTESVVIPTFLTYIGGGPVLRGFLMVLSRLGTGVLPVLLARRLKITPLKKWAVAWSTWGMAIPIGLLSVLWYSGLWHDRAGNIAPWMPWLFLCLYGAFYAMVGLNQQAVAALQGKLIAPNSRGKLFAISVMLGSPLAILAALWWMTEWIEHPATGFAPIFAAAAILFLFSGVTTLAAREEPDNFKQRRESPLRLFTDALRILKTDSQFRALAILAILFSSSFTLFPHYAALGRERLGLEFNNLVLLVCVQNGANALFCMFAGPMADRWGNRAALYFTVFGNLLGPFAALALSHAAPAIGEHWYWTVFALLGFSPVTQRLLINYTLEIARREDHPRYVAALGLCLAIPVVLLSPVVGLLIKRFGFDVAFWSVGSLLAAASVQIFWLKEPRQAEIEVAEDFYQEAA